MEYYVRPNFRLTKNDGQVVSSSAAYNADPYETVDDPLSAASIAQLKALGTMVNTQRNMTISYGNTTALGAMLQVNRKLSSNGRNVTLRVDGNYSDSDSKTFSTQDIQYFQLQDATRKRLNLSCLSLQPYANKELGLCPTGNL